MTQIQDTQLENVGDVVDYLRTKKGLKVIADEELPMPRTYDPMFGVREHLFYVASNGSTDPASLSIWVDDSTIQSFVPVEGFKGSNYKEGRLGFYDIRALIDYNTFQQYGKHDQIRMPEPVRVSRRNAPGKQASWQLAYPISREGYNFYIRHVFEGDDGNTIFNMFQEGGDAYFETRRTFPIGEIMFLKLQFHDPIQQAVGYEILNRHEIGHKPEKTSSRAKEMIGPLPVQHLEQEYREARRNPEGRVPTTCEGIDLAYQVMIEYQETLNSNAIVRLREQHAALTKRRQDLEGQIAKLPRQAIELLG